MKKCVVLWRQENERFLANCTKMVFISHFFNSLQFAFSLKLRAKILMQIIAPICKSYSRKSSCRLFWEPLRQVNKIPIEKEVIKQILIYLFRVFFSYKGPPTSTENNRRYLELKNFFFFYKFLFLGYLRSLYITSFANHKLWSGLVSYIKTNIRQQSQIIDLFIYQFFP